MITIIFFTLVMFLTFYRLSCWILINYSLILLLFLLMLFLDLVKMSMFQLKTHTITNWQTQIINFQDIYWLLFFNTLKMTNLPFLPGHRFSDPYKVNYHKTQQFVLKSQTCTGIMK